MATINVINHKRQNPGTMGRVLKYVSREDKTLYKDRRLVSGRDCTPSTAYLEFMTTKQLHQKTEGRNFYHFVQSFHPKEQVTLEQAHDIAMELAAQFDGFEVVAATHVDAEHIHSHLIVNSVSHISGKKLHQSRENLMQHRRASDEICLAHGLTVLQSPGQKQERENIRPREYRAALKGDSWKFRLMNAIDFCMARSRTHKDFVAGMKTLGYGVAWSPTRQHITYTCPNGMKCRDKRLHDRKYLKQNMEVEYGLREAQITEQQRAARPEQTLSDGGLRDPGRAVGGHDHFAPEQSTVAAGDRPDTGVYGDRAQPEPDVAVDADGAVLAGETGWEQSRRELEAFERGAGLPAFGDAAAVQAAPHLDAGGLSLAGNVAQLAGNLGQVIEEPEHKSPPKAVHEHKRGIGQKQDDHSGWQQEQTL